MIFYGNLSLLTPSYLQSSHGNERLLNTRDLTLYLLQANPLEITDTVFSGTITPNREHSFYHDNLIQKRGVSHQFLRNLFFRHISQSIALKVCEFMRYNLFKSKFAGNECLAACIPKKTKSACLLPLSNQFVANYNNYMNGSLIKN